MHTRLLVAGLGCAAVAGAESVVGVYVFHRHGDRTAKAWQPVNLTSLGADEVFASGDFFRRRYVAGDAALRISGMSADRAVLSQISATAPVDNVLHNSAVVFLQGLYPPSAGAGSESLGNGTRVEAPLGGYQYIPVNAVAASTGGAAAQEESSAWLQGGSGCSKAVVSSNGYLQTPEYVETLADTRAFYQGLLPVVNGTFGASQATFLNAYSIFDLVNVAGTHNTSIPAKGLLTEPVLAKLYDLASTHEWNLAFNASDLVRAISGSVLAGQIVSALEDVASGKPSAPLFSVQFGAYGAFMSFFGLAQLPSASDEFYGICDYASSMVFELVAPSATGWKADDLSVRFFFSNGTASDDGLKQFPLFGQEKTTLPWKDFKAGMNEFAVADTEHWCRVCGNTDGACASGATAARTPAGSGHGVTRPVAGVIGALVALVVVLGLEALILLVGGLRLVKKGASGGVKA